MSRLSHWLKERSAGAIDVAGVLLAVAKGIGDCWTALAVDKRKAGGWVRQRSEVVPTIVSLGLVVLLTIVDYSTSAEFRFTLFYLLIVAFAAWSGGRVAGILVALVSSMVLFAHEFASSGNQSHHWAFYWNFVMQIGVCVLFAFLVSAVRSLTKNLERRVRDRTLALEREVGERGKTEEQLRKTMRQFRQLAENISDAFWMRDVGQARMVYVSPAYEKIWSRSCRDLYQHPENWLAAIHPEDRDRVARLLPAAESAREYHEEYRILRPDGTTRWIRERAFPIRNASGLVVRIVGIAEDITERRRLEREILEISDREQARFGQELHDGLCQKLVSLAFDGGALERKLLDQGLPEAVEAERMAAFLDELITEARDLARGLFPVQLEADGLSVALRQLAAGISERAGVSCQFDCPEPVFVGDNAAANQLYRIAQEAVSNALKHAQARSILLQLRARTDLIELHISDDGVGISMPSTSSSGLGLHIIEYRARTIGGTLTVERGTTGGTVVSCLVRQPAP